MLSYGVVPSIYPPFIYFYFRPIWTHEATVEELAQRMGTTSEEIKQMMKTAVDALNVYGE